jgi:hypothetical protein
VAIASIMQSLEQAPDFLEAPLKIFKFHVVQTFEAEAKNPVFVCKGLVCDLGDCIDLCEITHDDEFPLYQLTAFVDRISNIDDGKWNCLSGANNGVATKSQLSRRLTDGEQFCALWYKLEIEVGYLRSIGEVEDGLIAFLGGLVGCTIDVDIATVSFGFLLNNERR